MDWNNLKDKMPWTKLIDIEELSWLEFDEIQQEQDSKFRIRIIKS